MVMTEPIELFAPPAAFDFVARLRCRIYAAVVRRPATLATRQGPLLLLACCHYRDGVSGPIIGFSQKLRAARISA
jgi:hypothetical protein